MIDSQQVKWNCLRRFPPQIINDPQNAVFRVKGGGHIGQQMFLTFLCAERMIQKKTQAGQRRLIAFALFILLSMPWLLLTACQAEVDEVYKPADYGTGGSRFALSLAKKYPTRSAGSSQERQAGDLIVRTLKDMGYEPVIESFSFTDDEGNTLRSRNISVTLPGQGFVRTDEEGRQTRFRRQVIVGAHYDSYFSAGTVSAYQQTTEPAPEPSPTPIPTPTPEPDSGTVTPRPSLWPTQTVEEPVPEPTLLDYDGIHDNASGVGTLLTLAEKIFQEKMGYDVILVAFGAGEARQAGAHAFVNQMTREEIQSTDAMYCIDAIYAGDKVYAHSGRNSLRGNYSKAYEMRRKLYEVTDVFYEHELYTNNGYMLYTNQGNFDVFREDINASVLYREWTLTDSDYVPFDEAGIPIVFFESFDYDGKSLDSLKESKNPAFSTSSGMIRHTPFDTTAYLQMIMNQRRSTNRQQDETSESIQDTDHLTRRVNNTAFVILEAIRKGVHDAEVQTEPLATSAENTTSDH